MTTHNVIRAYRFNLKNGHARCAFCNKPLTAQDEVTIIGKQAKAVVHNDCATLESEQ